MSYCNLGSETKGTKIQGILSKLTLWPDICKGTEKRASQDQHFRSRILNIHKQQDLY